MVRGGDDLHRIVHPLPPVPANRSRSPSSPTRRHEHRECNVYQKRWAVIDSSDAVSLRDSPDPRSMSPLPIRLTRSALGFREDFANTEGGGLSLRPASIFSHTDLVTISDQHYNPTVTAQQEEERSANVQRMIHNTEHAFEAVGKALNDLHVTSWLRDIPDPSAPSPVVPMHPKIRTDSPISSSLESRNLGVAHNPAPLRRKPVPPPQPERQMRKYNGEGGSPSKSPAKSSRWALPENLSIALLSQRFKRVVADEMLTPARLEELTRKREKAEAEARLRLECQPSKESLHSLVTDKSDISVEPFHLEKFVTRPSPLAERSSPPLAEDKGTPSNAPLNKDMVYGDPSLPNGMSKNDEKEEEDARNTTNITSPAPPSRTVPRLITKASIDLLPTIPEILATKPDSMRSRASLDSDELVYLNGPVLSSANPSFRHGPITYQKPDAGKDAANEVDETVDWKAFQMAILGGAGDLVSGMYEDDQNEMAEEMAEWFKTFGFETHGELISSCITLPPPRVSQDSCETIDTISPCSTQSDNDLPIPVLTEHKKHGKSGRHGAFDSIKFFGGSNLHRWAVDPEVKRYSLRETILSPPKPLVVGGDAPEDVSESAVDMVPMGCNMEHDLEEFLRWERDHVYGGLY